ncbi:MAG: class I SAM-dependent methyltransferase, partial [Planctomycetaceae bacterium]|nr:class I SAM-dependent methyltransferase [Planctomycetaceae bacterium]
SFYKNQAKDYDDFRRRLLKGRESLWQNMLAIDPYQNTTWMDMGGGTGSNLLFFGDAISEISKIYVVDLAGSLLEVADSRIHDSGWKNIETAEADATSFTPQEDAVDNITFSYSLTMIPDWFAAINHAWEILKPNGKIGVVDFYLSRKFPSQGHVKHNWLKRTFWPMWFAFDNVFPSHDHVPYLHNKFEPILFEEHQTRLPWFPFLKMPYYLFIGRKTN